MYVQTHIRHRHVYGVIPEREMQELLVQPVILRVHSELMEDLRSAVLR